MRWIYGVLLVLLACTSTQTNEVPKFVTSAINVARGIGDAVIRAKGLAELQRSVPELIPFLDADSSGQITLAEVEDFIMSAAEDPESVALLLTTLVLLRQ